ncbi:MAG: TolC family protein [Firmicutes bacterium]|nr:TolC family protein [Bacillota bacterium]
MKKIGVSILLGILLLGFTVGMSAAEQESIPATAAPEQSNQAITGPDQEPGQPGEGGQPALPQPEVVTLSLEQSIDLALANNPEVIQAKLDRDKASVDLDSAIDAARKIDENPGSYEKALVKEVNPKICESALRIAGKVYEIKLNSIRLSAEKAYYDVLKARRAVEIKEAALKRAEEQLRQARLNYQVGTVARNDVLSAEVQVAQAKAELTAARNQKDYVEMTFNKTLGTDLKKPFNLSSQFSYEPIEVDLDRVLAEQVDNQLSVIQARENLSSAKLKLACAGKYWAPNVYTYQLVKIEVDKAEIKYNQAVKDATLQIYQAYNTLQAAKDMVEMYQKAVEQAKESARLTNLRYQVGLATSLETINASLALSQAEDKALQAIYDYNLAKAKFKYNLFDLSTGSSASSASSGM